MSGRQLREIQLGVEHLVGRVELFFHFDRELVLGFLVGWNGLLHIESTSGF
jgi:hypothetical protein